MPVGTSADPKNDEPSSTSSVKTIAALVVINSHRFHSVVTAQSHARLKVSVDAPAFNQISSLTNLSLRAKGVFQLSLPLTGAGQAGSAGWSFPPNGYIVDGRSVVDYGTGPKPR